MSKQQLSLIVAATAKGEIGVDGTIPWKLPGDLKRFKDITMGHVVIMGRKTFESLGKPLAGRVNIVITSKANMYRQTRNVVKDLYYVGGLREAIDLASTFPGEAWVIGGARVYEEALPLVDRVELTLVSQHAERYDTVIPNFDFDPIEWKFEHYVIITHKVPGCPIDPVSHTYVSMTRKVPEVTEVPVVQLQSGNETLEEKYNHLFHENIALHTRVMELESEIQGPDGYATWKDAAVAERVHRVRLQQGLTEDTPGEVAAFKYPVTEDRATWSLGEWFRHFGGFIDKSHNVCFGSVWALNNLMTGWTKEITRQAELKHSKPNNVVSLDEHRKE